MKEDPRNTYYQTLASYAHYFVGTALERTGDAEEAALHFRKCLTLRKAMATNPKARLSQIDLAVAMARCGDYDEAAHVISGVLTHSPTDNRDYFQAACTFALCAVPWPGTGRPTRS